MIEKSSVPQLFSVHYAPDVPKWPSWHRSRTTNTLRLQSVDRGPPAGSRVRSEPEKDLHVGQQCGTRPGVQDGNHPLTFTSLTRRNVQISNCHAFCCFIYNDINAAFLK